MDDDDDIAILVQTAPAATKPACPSPLPLAESAIDTTPKRARDEEALPAAAATATSTVATKGGDGLSKMSLLAFGMAKATLINTGGSSQHTPKAQKLLKVESAVKTSAGPPPLAPASQAIKKEASAAATAVSSPSTPAAAATALSPSAATATAAAATVENASSASAQVPLPKKTQTSLLSFFANMKCPTKAPPPTSS